jgi:hypothetical protein
MNPGPLFRHQKAVALMLPVLATSAALNASASLPAAQMPVSGATLAQQYLADLKPAATGIAAAEAKLRALPVTASVAQVRAIVAPLAPELAKVESLSASQPAAATTGPGLETLGHPTVAFSGFCGASAKYASSSKGAVLQVGYTRYRSGFQSSGSFGCRGWINDTWSVPGKYTHFTADVGYS